jgi:hypothetical protein
MRKTLFGMAGAAALVFSFNVRASDVRAGDGDRGPAADGRHDQSHRSATAMLHRARASTTTEERSGSDAEAMEPRDASTDAGSASGEPAARAKSSSSSEEFLQTIWTAP